MGVRAVATTGIYCRPTCGARPHPEHVTGFPSPVAAEAAGYRSCLRCRPDRLVGPATGIDAPAPVVAAVGLLSAGYLDRHDEDDLARRVGYSTRQLRRLFLRHVGATPSFVARSRRAHFARRLLDETDLSLDVIARASGFGGVRQLHRVTTSLFGFAPSELRRRRRRGDVVVADGGLALRLPTGGAVDLDAVADHLAPRATPGVETVAGRRYRRTLEVCANPGVLEIELAEPGPDRPAPTDVVAIAHLPTFDSIIDDVARVRHLLGLDADPTAAEHLAGDPLLGPLVARRPNLRVVGAWDRFETAVRIVLGQQVSVASATALAGRLVALRGRRLATPVLGLTHLFPAAGELLDLDPAATGLPAGRAATVEALARAVLADEVDLFAVDPDATRAALLEVPGVGPWTAEMVLLRAGRDPDAFPASDLGLRRALAQRLGSPDLPTPAEARGLAERWRPHRALAATHLWAALADPDPTVPEDQP